MQSKHITDETDVGNRVPTFMQNSLGSLKVPTPHPNPHNRPPGSKYVKSGGNSTFGSSKSKNLSHFRP